MKAILIWHVITFTSEFSFIDRKKSLKYRLEDTVTKSSEDLDYKQAIEVSLSDRHIR